MGWLWLLVIAVVIYAIIRKIKRSSNVIVIKPEDFQRPGANPFQAQMADMLRRAQQQAAAQANGTLQKTVSCAHCGVIFPAVESFKGFDGDYCCREHRNAGPRKNG